MSDGARSEPSRSRTELRFPGDTEPQYTVGRAAELLGVPPAFLRRLEAFEAVTPPHDRRDDLADEPDSALDRGPTRDLVITTTEGRQEIRLAADGEIDSVTAPRCGGSWRSRPSWTS
jgi:hypothetical protein